MAQCVNHPDDQAVEQCESCRVPLCGRCLWYAESGQRLCERCARAWQEVGHTVYPPEQFAEGIEPSLHPPTKKLEQRGRYSGNDIDLAGFAAACLGGMVVLYCVPCLNMIAPLLGLIVGIWALGDVKRAINPSRTKLLAGIGVACGGLVLLGGILWTGLTIFLPMIMLLIESLSQTP